MSDQHIYTTTVQWKKERRGILSTTGLVDIEVGTPAQFPGGHDDIWSPEHMFVASADICLMNTFVAIAYNSKLDFTAYTSTAEGILDKGDDGYMITKITLKPHIVVSSESVVERTYRILEKAKNHCLITNSMKTIVNVEPTVTVE